MELKEVFARRLKQARKMHGLSLRELAAKLDGYISAMALSKYEKGVMLPGSDVVTRLCAVLHESADYFFRPPVVTLAKPDFRKQVSLKTKEQEKIRIKAADFFERYLELEQALGLDAAFVNPLKNYKYRTHEDVEKAAQELRKKWELGLDAIPNVIELLEDHQIKVFMIDAEKKFDGLSGWAGDIPIIVLNKQAPPDRKRLTALHELGHLLLNFSQKECKDIDIEGLCSAFASAMLMPESTFRRIFGGERSAISLNELLDIKAEYGISIAATMYRARALGLISDSRFKSFCIFRSKNHWRQDEPGTFNGNEKPRRFDRLLYRAVATEAISISKAAGIAGKSFDDINRELQVAP